MPGIMLLLLLAAAPDPADAVTIRFNTLGSIILGESLLFAPVEVEAEAVLAANIRLCKSLADPLKIDLGFPPSC